MLFPTTANEETPRRGGKPVLIADQLRPMSPERKAPPPESSDAPANSFRPTADSARTDWPTIPALARVQFSPWSVDRKGPPNAPAKRFVPIAARARTPTLGKPVLTSAQLSPLSLERMTPPVAPPLLIRGLDIPAKISVPTVANEAMRLFSGCPVLTTVQISPCSLERERMTLLSINTAKMSGPTAVISLTPRLGMPVSTAIQLSP